VVVVVARRKTKSPEEISPLTLTSKSKARYFFSFLFFSFFLIPVVLLGFP
jgi:hypothetical protein